MSGLRCAPSVNAEFCSVVAVKLRRVRHPLKLVLVLIEWAAAAVDELTGTEVEAFSQLIRSEAESTRDVLPPRINDETGEEAGTEFVQVQSGHADIARRVLSKV